VDAEPPTIVVREGEDGRVTLEVSDRVSSAAGLVARVSLDGGAWSEWRPVAELASLDAGESGTIEVEAKDEEGNVATAEQALIRGRAVAGDSGCGCTVAGSPSSGGGNVAGLLGLGLLGVALRLGRRAKKPTPRQKAGPVFAAVTMAIASTYTGCSCGDDVDVKDGPKGGCVEPDCVTLQPGLAGAYTSLAVSGSTIWVAGYAEADWNSDLSWGDLVVGKHEGDKGVAWVPIDGVPAEPPPDPKATNVNGYRGGQTSPGDDVGLWTSIAIDPSGHPAVAYYDRTNKALRFASTTDDTTWTVSTVDSRPSGDVGRYAKLVYLNATPVIAYLAIEPTADGAVQSSVRVATGSSTGTWTFEDAVIDAATPCRKAFCASGTECVATTGLCTATLSDDSCGGACGSGKACVDQGGSPACVDTYDKSKLDSYPEAVGDYIAAVPDGKGGIGIAYYDRVRGNLGVASKSGGAWTTLIVDGATADGATDTGDMGIGASLFIDGAGDWHLTYVDGLNENVRYARLTGGTTVAAIEVVDDGLSLDGVKFEDGQHVVGDDSNVLVLPSGEVHVTYQDATSGKLRYAVGAPSGDSHTWTVKAVDHEGFGGAFSSQIIVDGAVKLAHWYRVGGQEVRGDVAIQSP
jgi:MYXO-CTERM domain-containing protein